MEPEAREKKLTIIISGRAHEVEGRPHTYEQIVNLRYDDNPPQGANVKVSVTYSHGPKENKSGTLYPGQTVEVKNEMLFDVTATDRS